MKTLLILLLPLWLWLLLLVFNRLVGAMFEQLMISLCALLFVLSRSFLLIGRKRLSIHLRRLYWDAMLAAGDSPSLFWWAAGALAWLWPIRWILTGDSW